MIILFKRLFKKKWEILAFLVCLLFSVIFVIRSISSFNYLITAKKDVLTQWYPHFGSIVFCLVNNLTLLQTLLGIVIITGFLYFLLSDIHGNRKKYWDLVSVKTIRVISIYFFIVIFSLIIAEIIFRKVFSVVPGIGQTHFDFRTVDTLKIYRGYITDERGIFKIDYSVAKDIEEAMHREGRGAFSLVESKNFYGQILGVYEQAALLDSPEIRFDFAVYYRELANKGILNAVDSSIIEYGKHPINSDGFRSIAFSNYTSRRKKVLLLGDSFTFGQQPQYLFQSFADYLLSQGVIAFNTGISSTDPTQYVAIAKEFIPLLHPDYVVVNLCLANDAFYYRRKLQPNVPFFYATNAGDLYATQPDKGNFSSAQEAYNNILKLVTIPAQKNIFYAFYTKTAVGTVLWQFLDKLQIVEEAPRPVQHSFNQMAYPSCNDDLKEIKAIADSNNCRFIVVAIPAYTDTGLTNVSNYPNLLTGMQYYTAPVTRQDYEMKSLHYNASGHKKHGDFILKLIGEE